jgi:predicted MFS family arabinose efflux permease
MTRLREHREFRRFWSASTVSDFGTYVTTLALQVLVVVTLSASATEVGIVNAARWLPYLMFGLVAGVLADRHRRRPILVGTDLGRAVVLGAIPVLAAFDALSIPLLVVLMLVLGTLSVQSDAAHQSFLPRLVVPASLTQANARLEQSAAVAQSTGPVLSGGLIAALGAPLAIVVDAASFLVSGAILATLRTVEPIGRPVRRSVSHELREGLRYVYRHPMLAPYAVATHAWFLFNAALTTVFVPFVLRDLRLTPLTLGLAYALGGVGGVLGSQFSGRVSRRLGTGVVVILDRGMTPVSFSFVALASTGVGGWIMVAVGQFLFWFAVSMGGPAELGYRQSVTPDQLQGRMNATIRSINVGLAAFGALAGGLLADSIGYRATLWIAVTCQLAGASGLALSRYRHAH